MENKRPPLDLVLAFFDAAGQEVAALLKAHKGKTFDAVDYRTVRAWGEEVFRRMGGVQRVVNAAGGASLDQSVAALAPGGEVALMGLFTHADTPPNLVFLMMKGASVRGTAVGSAAAYADLVAAVDAGGVKPPVDRVFAFEQAREAYQAAVSPQLFGKIVIKVQA